MCSLVQSLPVIQNLTLSHHTSLNRCRAVRVRGAQGRTVWRTEAKQSTLVSSLYSLTRARRKNVYGSRSIRLRALAKGEGSDNEVGIAETSSKDPEEETKKAVETGHGNGIRTNGDTDTKDTSTTDATSAEATDATSAEATAEPLRIVYNPPALPSPIYLLVVVRVLSSQNPNTILT
eukprot:5925891-Pyramimonas_sp.AAC.1